MKRFTYWLLLLTAMALLLPSCIGITPSKYRPRDDAPKEEMPLSRADPAFVQYLERQSMLAKSSEMAKVVSGSELAWRSSASSGEPGAMMNYADTWVLIHPLTLLTTSRSSAFALLDDASSWPVFREAGARGLYVAPIQGGGAIWRKPGSGLDSGEDVVQYDFSRTAGTDKEYGRLMGKSIDNGAIIGSDLIPAATGLGPDFFLATRNVREYPGVYCMVEVPEQHWGLLPALGENDESAALSASEVAALSKLGLLPKAMRDAASSMGQIGGWATSAPVRAVDGNKYRWVYRYHGSPKYAVLNWEDPSQTAHRILSGSAVRQVGLQGQALIGLRFEAFQGLEAAQEGAAASSFSIEPALTAAQSMSREIRKYGGWSWLRDDDLPLKSVQRFLSGGTDFIYDSVFSPAAEHALLTGDASLAKFMADEALRLKIDARKLVHVMPGQDGINYSLPHIRQLAEGAGGKKAADFVTAVRNTMRNIASRATPSPASGNYLYVTAPGLAALALGAGTEEAAHKQLASIRKGHSLLTFFKAMQPGVMMLAGQDLCGALPLQWGGHTGNSKNFSAADSSRGAYGLTSSTARLSVSAHGVPRAPTLYPAPDMQVHENGSFLKEIGAFLRQRTQYGIGKGTLVARLATKGKGSIALLTRLPGGKSWLLSVCNFSRQPISENISLAAHPAVLKTSGKRALLRSGGGTCALSGANASVQLGAWEGVALVIGAGQTAADAPKKPAEQGEKITPIPDFSQPEASAPEAQAAAAPVKEAPVPTEKAAPAEEATPAEKPVAKSAETSAEKSAEEKAKLAEEAEKRRKRNDADDASSMLGARKKRPAEAPAKAAAEAQPEPEAQEITQPAASPENVRQISYSLPASALAPRKKAESAAPVLTTKRIAAAPAVIKKDAELMAAVASELGAPAKRKTAVSTAKAPAAEPLVTKAPAAEPPAVKPPAAPPAPSATKQAAQPALQQTPAQAGNPLQAGTTSGPDVFRYVYAASNSHSKSAAEAHAAKLTKEGFAARVATEGGTYRTVIDFIGKPMETRIPKAKLKALGIKDAWMVSKKPM